MADYQDTLNLPHTVFPMKADLARREPEILRYWQAIDLYRRHQQADVRESRAECRRFAAEQVERQRADCQRLGVLGNWTQPYLTMDYAVEADILRALARILANGHLQRGLNPFIGVLTAALPWPRPRSSTRIEQRLPSTYASQW